MTASVAVWRAGLLAVGVIAGGTGYWLGHRGETAASTPTLSPNTRTPLYYYDPMVPNQKFDTPG